MGGENIHAGHRKRQRDKYLAHGLDSFTDVEAIELLLYYALPRQDTNELAHQLLDRFRGLRGLLEAEPRELLAADGVGEQAAVLLSLVTALNRRYLQAPNRAGVVLKGTEDAGAYLKRVYAYEKRELFLLLCLGPNSKVLCHKVLALGTPDRVTVSARDVVATALRENAVRVILSHNHLADIAVPSKADIEATRRLYHVLTPIGVELSDHIIVSGGDFVSMRDSGYFDEF